MNVVFKTKISALDFRDDPIFERNPMMKKTKEVVKKRKRSWVSLPKITNLQLTKNYTQKINKLRKEIIRILNFILNEQDFLSHI